MYLSCVCVCVLFSKCHCYLGKCHCYLVNVIGIKGAIARVVRVRTGNGPMALVNIMFPLWSCSLSLITAMLQKEDGEVLYSSGTIVNHFQFE